MKYFWKSEGNVNWSSNKRSLFLIKRHSRYSIKFQWIFIDQNFRTFRTILKRKQNSKIRKCFFKRWNKIQKWKNEIVINRDWIIGKIN